MQTASPRDIISKQSWIILHVLREYTLTLPLPISHLCENYLPLPISHLCEFHMCTCIDCNGDISLHA